MGFNVWTENTPPPEWKLGHPVPAGYAQGSDGVPHLTYFYKPEELSFTWDGFSDYIEIGKGGYGEHPSWLITAPTDDEVRDASDRVGSAGAIIAAFLARCEAFVYGTTPYMEVPR